MRREVAARTGGVLFPHEIPPVPSGVAESVVTRRSELSADARERAFLERVVPPDGLDVVKPGMWVSRETDLRPISDVWPRAIPFWLWKPVHIARAAVNPSKILRRLNRLFHLRRLTQLRFVL